MTFFIIIIIVVQSSAKIYPETASVFFFFSIQQKIIASVSYCLEFPCTIIISHHFLFLDILISILES